MFARARQDPPQDTSGFTVCFVGSKLSSETDDAVFGPELAPLLKHCTKQSVVLYPNAVAGWSYLCPIDMKDAVVTALHKRGLKVKAGAKSI
jgi:hypothetical protein